MVTLTCIWSHGIWKPYIFARWSCHLVLLIVKVSVPPLQGDRNGAQQSNHSLHTVKQKMCCFESLYFLQKAIWRQGSSVPQGQCLKTGGLEKKNVCGRNRSFCLILKSNRNNELKEDCKCKYVLWKFYLLSFRWHRLNSLCLAKRERENKLRKSKETAALKIAVSFLLCSCHVRMAKVSGLVRQKGWGNHTVIHMIANFLISLVSAL